MNSASRLLSIYDKLAGRTDDISMTKMWASIFNLPYDKATIEDDLQALLVGIRSEVDFTRLRLTAHGVPLELMEPGLPRLKDIAAPASLHTKWAALRGNLIPPECRQTFVWAAWVLRDEDEEVMPHGDMLALSEELNALESGLNEAAMSPYLQAFVQRQIDTIRAALRLSEIQGVNRPGF